MSTTRELVEAFNAKRPPDEIQTVLVRQFEPTDPDDPDSSLRELAPQERPATYCWRLDVAWNSYWIGQVNDAKLLEALKPATEDEDQGAVIGTLAKVRPDGNILAYGPVELHAQQWQRLQALTNVVIS